VNTTLPGPQALLRLRSSIVHALADNPVGHLVEDLMYQGGVDQSHVRWVKYDGVGRTVRNGLNFTERGLAYAQLSVAPIAAIPPSPNSSRAKSIGTKSS